MLDQARVPKGPAGDLAGCSLYRCTSDQALEDPERLREAFIEWGTDLEDFTAKLSAGEYENRDRFSGSIMRSAHGIAGKSMKELGGTDLEERTRQVSPKQPVKEILSMDLETATGLLDDRYCHLDLLEESAASAGGVTPVVTQPTAGTA